MTRTQLHRRLCIIIYSSQNKSPLSRPKQSLLLFLPTLSGVWKWQAFLILVCTTCVKKKKKIVCAVACAARNSALRDYVDTEKHNVLAGWRWRCGVGLGETSLKNQLKNKTKQKTRFSHQRWIALTAVFSHERSAECWSVTSILPIKQCHVMELKRLCLASNSKRTVSR